MDQEDLQAGDAPHRRLRVWQLLWGQEEQRLQQPRDRGGGEERRPDGEPRTAFRTGKQVLDGGGHAVEEVRGWGRGRGAHSRKSWGPWLLWDGGQGWCDVAELLRDDAAQQGQQGGWEEGDVPGHAGSRRCAEGGQAPCRLHQDQLQLLVELFQPSPGPLRAPRRAPSDGQQAPEQRVERAVQRGVEHLVRPQPEVDPGLRDRVESGAAGQERAPQLPEERLVGGASAAGRRRGQPGSQPSELRCKGREQLREAREEQLRAAAAAACCLLGELATVGQQREQGLLVLTQGAELCLLRRAKLADFCNDSDRRGQLAEESAYLVAPALLGCCGVPMHGPAALPGRFGGASCVYTHWVSGMMRAGWSR